MRRGGAISMTERREDSSLPRLSMDLDHQAQEIRSPWCTEQPNGKKENFVGSHPGSPSIDESEVSSRS